MKRRVVVTGLGVVSPVGIGIDAVWESLINGRSGAGPVTHFDATNYACRIAAEVKNLDQYLDPSDKDLARCDLFVQFALVAATLAVEHSGLELDKEDLDRFGSIVGSGIGGLQILETQKEILMEKGPRRVSPFLIPMMIGNMASGMISMRHGLRGPNTSVVTACATGNHCIGDALNVIRRDEADLMLAGGTEAAITPLGVSGFGNMKALATHYNDDPTHASRPFDKDRDGFLMGEGSAILVLEELEHARKRNANVYAEVVGYGMTADAFHMSQPAPEGRGGREAMRRALRDAEISPEDVDYINAHGTATPVGDVAEAQAINALFGEHAQKIAVSSTKSMTGHLLGAAGALESIVCAKTVSNGTIPPTINLDNQDPECRIDCVPNTAREAKVSVALNNSFGFGGQNCVLVFRKI
ncbi:MAG TPA: beta-ketoacyl-ACP synthase II [bacterium]|nr:beta-ketoacyl-ACP synthase II [bacterium]HQP96936.1 beta-ketoacyl-ACP synthase II [bacterium]